MSYDGHPKLAGEQAQASDPAGQIWLAASAGTGKTSVLAARVLRLLLRGTKPDTILCLTFTKAGATEMAHRVHRQLARWVLADAKDVRQDLFNLGEAHGSDADIANARRLFARVLEARGGGLRVMTIHAFCQTLLAGFPAEAGLAPGFRPLEAREEQALVAQVLADLVVAGEAQGDPLIGQLQALSRRLGEAAARGFLVRAARSQEALEGLGPGLVATVRGALGVPLEFHPDELVDACHDDRLPGGDLAQLMELLAGWNGARGAQRLAVAADWQLRPPTDRAAALATLRSCWCKQDGSLHAAKGFVPAHPDYPELARRLDDWCGALVALQTRARLADDLAAALAAARRFGRAYGEAKRRAGLVDFDDLIATAKELLLRPGSGDWIRFKLDQATDHILVDESQDTNADQWAIVAALTAEFYAGEGAKGPNDEAGRQRTIFTVGDFKQAIFSFQGTDPEHYRGARDRFATTIAAGGLDLQQLALNRSFRSSPAVLDVVDAVLAEIGEEQLGLGGDRFEPHVSAVGMPGSVTLLAPTRAPDADPDDAEGWVEGATRAVADRIAGQVAEWLRRGLRIKNGKRALEPQDVMILVRKRGELAGLLVARLHEHGVPVAGVDRLRLRAPLVVKDLVAAMRFAAQPDDDLNLANLLVSPLFGWTQEQLFAVAHNRTGSLAAAVGDQPDLRRLLNAADRVTPFAFLEELLSGPLQGRAKLIARLGEPVRDAIDELLNAALQFEREGVATLQPFLAWFDRNDGEIIRDAGGVGNAVRVLTVHGAKGLEAPLVILADACVNPEQSPDHAFKATLDGLLAEVPLPQPRKDERAIVPALARAYDERQAKAREEHWRLLYVAMTRAAERLVVAGALGERAKEVPPESWHAAVQAGLARLGVEPTDGADGAGASWHYGAPLNFDGTTTGARAAPSPVAQPAWLSAPAPVEARPVRPLAPSSLGEDCVVQPPVGMAGAAERGRLLHSLFERLPALPPRRRRAAGLQLLAERGADPALLDAVLAVLDDPTLAEVFAPDALVEAPIAGVVGGQVIAGTVDRLIVRPDRVDLLDFKTGRRVPANAAAIPDYHLRQMAAYVAVLETIFPDRAVRAALLYIDGPALHWLGDAQLAAHHPAMVEQSATDA